MSLNPRPYIPNQDEEGGKRKQEVQASPDRRKKAKATVKVPYSIYWALFILF